MFYEMTIAGCRRSLPICPLNENLSIAGFVMFGDVEITVNAARELLKKAPEFDVILTAESKGIPLAHEMAKQSGNRPYIVARKEAKLYMRDVIETDVESITTAHMQKLCLGSIEAEEMRGKRVLIVDDVISTGGSLKSMELLVEKVGGGAKIVGEMAVLAEGDAADRKDILFLEKLPLFHPDGTPID